MHIFQTDSGVFFLVILVFNLKVKMQKVFDQGQNKYCTLQQSSLKFNDFLPKDKSSYYKWKMCEGSKINPVIVWLYTDHKCPWGGGWGGSVLLTFMADIWDLVPERSKNN